MLLSSYICSVLSRLEAFSTPPLQGQIPSSHAKTQPIRDLFQEGLPDAPSWKQWLIAAFSDLNNTMRGFFSHVLIPQVDHELHEADAMSYAFDSSKNSDSDKHITDTQKNPNLRTLCGRVRREVT